MCLATIFAVILIHSNTQPVTHNRRALRLASSRQPANQSGRDARGKITIPSLPFGYRLQVRIVWLSNDRGIGAVGRRPWNVSSGPDSAPDCAQRALPCCRGMPRVCSREKTQHRMDSHSRESAVMGRDPGAYVADKITAARALASWRE